MPPPQAPAVTLSPFWSNEPMKAASTGRKRWGQRRCPGRREQSQPWPWSRSPCGRSRWGLVGSATGPEKDRLHSRSCGQRPRPGPPRLGTERERMGPAAAGGRRETPASCRYAVTGRGWRPGRYPGSGPTAGPSPWYSRCRRPPSRPGCGPGASCRQSRERRGCRDRPAGCAAGRAPNSRRRACRPAGAV
jgi:hypothetical protein